eukprot:CAMPEP_0174738694 /NCGR_PEP_ID=MMETSP1094-20130205/70365_1 /TAXON_ID=156173 /ORGANISM="Chrysochromulina brevifilum, Strain UTEX LB 985" /LENGTH=101 /DNA_ID=CAMNT_0015942157 /DNA_START=355 /DNA_END=660 /DNA_ORIENTATION=+
MSPSSGVSHWLGVTRIITYPSEMMSTARLPRAKPSNTHASTSLSSCMLMLLNLMAESLTKYVVIAVNAKADQQTATIRHLSRCVYSAYMLMAYVVTSTAIE